MLEIIQLQDIIKVNINTRNSHIFMYDIINVSGTPWGETHPLSDHKQTFCHLEVYPNNIAHPS